MIVSIIRFILFIPARIFNLFILKSNKVAYKESVFNGILFVRNQGTIQFGREIKINSSKIKNVIGGDTRTSFVVKKGAELIIGENVKISNSAFYCAEKISIGDNVMIGGSTKIWDTDFHTLDPQKRFNNPNEGYNTRPVIIHDNAFIGGFSIVLKGTEIGENSVIGAGSVVAGKIPPNEIWAGNPAMFIKKLND